MNLTRDELAFELLELGDDGVLLKVEDLRLERLAQREDRAASEVLEEDALGDLLADLTLGVDLAGVGQTHFGDGILNLAVFDDRQVLIDLAVTLVRVHDDVEVLVGAEHLFQNVAERFFEHAYQCGLFDVLQLAELHELIDHIDRLCFLCHISCVSLILLDNLIEPLF